MAQEYKVLSQAKRMNINAAGTNFSHDVEVTYRIESGPAKGTVSTIVVPQGDHNADYVDAAVREDMANFHGVASLGTSE
jgi:hypothetical protein